MKDSIRLVENRDSWELNDLYPSNIDAEEIGCNQLDHGINKDVEDTYVKIIIRSKALRNVVLFWQNNLKKQLCKIIGKINGDMRLWDTVQNRSTERMYFV